MLQVFDNRIRLLLTAFKKENGRTVIPKPSPPPQISTPISTAITKI